MELPGLELSPIWDPGTFKAKILTIMLSCQTLKSISNVIIRFITMKKWKKGGKEEEVKNGRWIKRQQMEGRVRERGEKKRRKAREGGSERRGKGKQHSADRGREKITCTLIVS